MWIALICLCATFYSIRHIISHVLKAKNKAKISEDKDEGLPELSAWATLCQVILSVTAYRNKPTYEISVDLGQKYGPVHVVKTGKIIPFKSEVWINNSSDLELAKRVMTASSIWPDRWPLKHYLHKATFSKPLGLLFGGGDYYKRPHRLLLRLLHQFDFFKPSRMENKVLFEAMEMESELEDLIHKRGNGRSAMFSPHTMFERNTLNVILQVVMSHRFSRGDPVAEEIIRGINKFNRQYKTPYNMLEIFPWLQHVPWLTFLGSLYDSSHHMFGIFRKIIADKRRELSSHPTKPEDLVDGFILEIDKMEGKDEHINDNNLMVIMRDMIYAGTDTVNSVLEHSILHLSLNPDIQQRVQAEIDEVIGQTRAPQYSDKARMKYTQAVLLEVLRVASPVPNTIRTSVNDTEMLGTRFRKGTLCAICIYGIHRNTQIWKDPLVFDPERFLNSNGEIINADKILPFGLGKRSCLGESVANVSLFIFFVTVFRKFKFKISMDHPAPSLRNVEGLSRCPMPFHVEMCSRSL